MNDSVVSSFVKVPAGRFAMGSNEGQDDEAPVHSVYVDAFEIGVYPVTRREYELFVRATAQPSPREWLSREFAHADLPVVGVSWDDAVAYCAWLTNARLPTEAEWEWAARGGRESERYPWGDEIPAWIPAGGKGPRPGPWPVTLGEPNGFGIFGIAANVHEWCADWHSRDYYASSPERNPAGPLQGQRRASRGGSWRHAVTISRTAARSKLDPTFRYTDYGFRIARSI
jgi:formylglycine-generating enzyme required for sulfatase activity